VLIDEPEISLHIAWQQQFLEDLITVAKLVKFDAIVSFYLMVVIFSPMD